MTAAVQAPILVDTEALAVYLGVPVGTIRYWAHTDRWTPHGTTRTRRWELDQARTSYRTRRPDPEDDQHG